MLKRIFSGIVLTLLLIAVLTLVSNIPLAKAEPSEPPITEWGKTYGGGSIDVARSVVQTVDGGYVMAGYTDSFGAGRFDFWLVKTDTAGNMEWNRTYGGENNDYAWSVIQTSDGGYALAGFNDDFWLVKTDAFGNVQWNRTYGGPFSDEAFSLIQTSDGGYALAGVTYTVGGAWLVKTDARGNMLWSRTFDYYTLAWSVIQTSDGGYALAGLNDDGSGLWDVWLAKTDSAGNVLWNRTYGGENYDAAHSVVETVDGGYILAGYTTSGAGEEDVWLIKTDAAGNMDWNRTYGADFATSVVQTGDGGYAVACCWTFWLLKTDLAGNMQWTKKSYGGASRDWAQSVVQTSDGGYAIAGSSYSYGAGNWDFWLVKLAGPGPQVIAAIVDIQPYTLNLRSKGKWITAYIELPEGYNAKDINVSTIMLNNTIPAELRPTSIQDHDSDTIPDLMVKFNRAQVISYILSNINMKKRSMTITLTITGKLKDSTPFQESKNIRIIG